jgi:ssDNA-binding Zn-finger/Zn-ribbon topoisomerase 1
MACPACDNPFMVEKNSVKKGVFLRCPKCKEESTVE